MVSIFPHWPAAPGTVASLSTRRSGGCSMAPYGDVTGAGGLNLGLHVGDDPAAVQRNRALLKAQLPGEPAWLTQVHGNRVMNAATVSATPQADASFTTQPGVVCAILSADCMPVLLCDSRGRVVGAAHAGWRGLAAGVVENTVKAMQEAGADRLLAWLGPAIGPRHFEVGEDVRAAFQHLGREADQAFVAIQGQSGKYWANLPRLARLALARVGVTQVAGGADCTVSDAQQFYSFRRDRITGRMASLIWIR